ncbi:MAG: D-alanine--D-alanine ligase [Defluviitaleaceae bacterium]|nr:D-alanine--D-alanine ligase [Defluviitaleaceae bacterium]
MNLKNVLVLFGGCSPEHDISLASASGVIHYLEGYNIVPVCITRDGRWMLYDGKLDNLRNVDWERFGTPAVLSPDRASRGLLRIVGDKVRTLPIDVVFPILHGKNGEDGSIQGLCQLAGIPCVGCGVMASAVCLDKTMAKIVAQSLKIPQTEYIVFKDGLLDDLESVMKAIRYKIGYPCFIKPADAGSSIGISIAKNKKDLRGALGEALAVSSKIIAEKAVRGRELECGVFGRGDEIMASHPGEIIADGEFYDYSAKYLKEGTKTIIRAEIPEKAAETIKRHAVDIFRAVDGRGLARVDFFLEESGRVVFNEINTMPGFTAISMFSMMWEANGLSMPDLVNRLIEIACSRV